MVAREYSSIARGGMPQKNEAHMHHQALPLPADADALRARLADAGLLRSRNLIAGAWRSAVEEGEHPVLNPSNQQVLATVPASGADDARAAVEAAHAAGPAWAALTAKERGAILRRWHDLILAHRQDLGVILAAEQGKPLAESVGEVVYGAGFVDWFAEEGKRAYGDVVPAHARDKRLVVLKQPVGVTALVTPWNFPSAMITRKVGPALAAGCTVVLKPAEDTPLSALALGELAQRAGVPPGVLNIITTADPVPIGEVFTTHPLVRKLSFTGSTRVGKLLMAKCAGTVKKVSLELGGNAAFIVFDDADLDAAVAGLMACKFRNTGQTCISANRIFVHDAVFDAFVDKLAAAVRALVVGDALADGTQQGPLINAAALRKVSGLVDDAVALGARVVEGGCAHERGGLYFRPTVLTGVASQARMWHEEIFGPVAALQRFQDEGEVVARANDTPYGLAGYFYSRDVGRAWRVAEALEAGIVGVNEGFISTELAPFGGVKESGIGREGSKYGIEDYLEIKYVCFGGLADRSDGGARNQGSKQ
jgi:succinate-semialdehyde dehydrogenase/glutarate-semialdehyde dehydrogenase